MRSKGKSITLTTLSGPQKKNRKRVLFDLGVERVKEFVDDFGGVSKVAEMQANELDCSSACSCDAPNLGQCAGCFFANVHCTKHLLKILACFGQIVLDTAFEMNQTE
jgi:hypothetical protein